MRWPQEHVAPLASDPAVLEIADALGAGRSTSVTGAAGSSTTLVAGAIAARSRRRVLLVVPHIEDADDAVDDLRSAGIEATRLPAMETLPGETGASLELFAERLALLRRVVERDAVTPVVVAPIHALMQAVPHPDRLGELALRLTVGDDVAPTSVARWLEQAGYSRVDAIEEPGDFAIRGGILDVFPPAGSIQASGPGEATGETPPVRIDFFGDEIESITEVDLATMGSDRRLQGVELLGAKPELVASDDSTTPFVPLLEPGWIAVLADTLETTEQGRSYYDRVVDARGISGPPAVFAALLEHAHAVCEINPFTAGPLDPRAGSAALPVGVLPELDEDASQALRDLAARAVTQDVHVLCLNDAEARRLRELLAEIAPEAQRLHVHTGALHRGFEWAPEERPAVLLVPYHEVLHRYHARRRGRRMRHGRATDAFLELRVGDHVVHADHGVARFIELRTMAVERGGAEVLEEFMTLEFAKRSRLHVPVSQIDRVQRYVGGHGGRPPLSTLGGRKWSAQKSQAEESVRDLAAELLRVQAAREAMPGIRYPADTAWQREFEAEFPYEETEDQLTALTAIKADMAAPRPMDRLVCGDVGYGKTELAIRAAFKAAEYGKQVAVLVPTTLLAEQHERTFRGRFADYPFRVESLSRFKSRRKQNEVLARTRRGEVDVLIGTHRLLSSDVRFGDLGLVIIDEEQRFGVEHKSSLLKLRMTVDVLTLSATPIPRTLHMAMLGLRDISSLSTPPMDRRAVVTEVLPHNETRIRRALLRELSREGQVYVVHNRVHDIQTVADDIQRLAPDARIVVGHGQMAEGELEAVMREFVERRADILVCTTIIESGIDIPTANTMIINDAQNFGLADLHQLRGRVGRYKHRAYCYLLVPSNKPIPEVAQKRLRAVEEFSMLGAGFKIAMRDLEIRGAGNLLGAEQSGHIAAVGYDMYCRLLERAVKELRSEPTATAADVVVDIGASGMLPRTYVRSDVRRLDAYRRVATSATAEDLAAIERDLTEAYGDLPAQAERLLELARLRVAAAPLAIRSITVQDPDVVFRCEEPAPVAAALEGAAGTVRVLSASADEVREVFYRPPSAYLEPSTLLPILVKRLGEGAAASGNAPTMHA